MDFAEEHFFYVYDMSRPVGISLISLEKAGDCS